MKALVSINDVVIEVNAGDEDELITKVKDIFVNDYDDRLDEINEKIYDDSFDFNDECLVELQQQYDALERKSEQMQRADDISALRRLGYSIQ